MLKCLGAWVLWVLGHASALGHLGTWHLALCGAESKGDTYELGTEATTSVGVAHMEPCLKQLKGQAKGHPACTHRSGPLPASLASATCPLLRGTLESAGASCALTGTRGTGWNTARNAKAWGRAKGEGALEYGSSACSRTVRSFGRQHAACSGRAPRGASATR